MAHETIHLLLVTPDDDLAGSFLQHIQPYSAFPCTRATCAAQALNCLCGEAGYFPLPYPYLILLDLDAADEESLRFLKALRWDPALRPSIVFAFSYSSDSKAVTLAVGAGVNLCLAKRTITTDFARFLVLLFSYRSQEFPPDRR